MDIELRPLAYRWEQDGWRCDVIAEGKRPRWVLMSTGSGVVVTEAQGYGTDIEDARVRAERVLRLLTEGL